MLKLKIFRFWYDILYVRICISVPNFLNIGEISMRYGDISHSTWLPSASKQVQLWKANYKLNHTCDKDLKNKKVGKPYNAANAGHDNFPWQPVAVLNFILETHFLGERMLLGGSTMVLSIQTTIVSGTVWLQFAIQVLNGGCKPQFGGKEW